jgi:hypothetical protein
MALSVILTGCSGGAETGNTEEVTDKASSATVTLKMYMVSEKPVSEETAKLINAEFNKITKSKFKTQVNISFCTYDTYYQTVEKVLKANQEYADLKEEARKHLTSAKNAAKKQGITIDDAWLDAYYAANPKYAEFREVEVSEETVVTEEETVMEQIEGADGAAISVLKYPDERENQIDIFWFGGYDRYLEYIGNDWLAYLDDNISAKLKEYINPDFLTWSSHVGGGMTYAIPNNNPVGEYTYLLLNKELVDHYSYNPATMGSLAACKNFLEDVKTYNPECAPIVGELPVVNMHYWSYDLNTNRINPNKFSLLASSSANRDLDITKTDNSLMNMTSIFSNTDYYQQLRTIYEYKDNGYVVANPGADQKVALKVVKGGAELAAQYADEYYMNVLEYPRLTEDDICSSMFGVSNYCLNVDRAMEIITCLNTNAELKNVLQYGCEDVHYSVNEDGTVKRLNDNYVMDNKKTGNMFISYLEEGTNPDIWKYAKSQNYEALANLSLSFGIFDSININMDGPAEGEGETGDSDSADEEETDTRMAAYLIPELEKLSAEFEAALKAVNTLEEFDAFWNAQKSKLMNHTAVKTHANGSNDTSIYAYYSTWMYECGFATAE